MQDHSDHTVEGPHHSGSSTETLSPTDAQPTPTLSEEVKAAVQQINIQSFVSTMGEPDSTHQTELSHETPGEVR